MLCRIVFAMFKKFSKPCELGDILNLVPISMKVTMKSKSILITFLLLFLLAVSCAPQTAAPASSLVTLPAPTKIDIPASSATATVALTQDLSNTFFDDFSYAFPEEMTSHGWTLRAGTGWPGVTGATFRSENVSILEDADLPGNRLLRMTSSTDGMPSNTFQTQICHRRKYLEGTYAARVHFSNEPASGPDGDQVVETFYTITPYEEPLKPEYSEMDFEYLPNGGWGLPPMSFAFTTWETVQIEPWNADNKSDQRYKNTEGWHTLVVQAMDGTVRYFVDGKQTAAHTGNYYPDAPMSINFNLWFINDGLNGSSETRSYQEEIDWVYHEANTLITPKQVEQKILELRQSETGFMDTVPAGSPALESLCDL